MAKDKTDPSTSTRMISILGHIRFSGEPFTLKIINKIYIETTAVCMVFCIGITNGRRRFNFLERLTFF